jgi:hypothetical protein
MEDRTPSPLAVFMRELRESKNNISVQIEPDNAKNDGLKAQERAVERARIIRHSSMPSIRSCSPRCEHKQSRWEDPCTSSIKSNARWSLDGIDLHRPRPPAAQHDTCESPTFPQRRGSVEKTDFPEHRIALLGNSADTQETSDPPRCPRRRSSVEVTSLAEVNKSLEAKVATSPVDVHKDAHKDVVLLPRDRLPAYKLALELVQQKYASGVNNLTAPAARLPVLPTPRQESLVDETSLLTITASQIEL